MSNYPIGSFVEILEGSQWNTAEVIDADEPDDEICVNFLGSNREEWICHKTVNLRKINKPHVVAKPKPKEVAVISPVEVPPEVPVIVAQDVAVVNTPKEEPPLETSSFQSKYKVGDSVLAAWSKSKNYQARVEAVLPNNEYRVQFEDGLKKIVSEDQMIKEADIVPDPSVPKYTTRHKSIDFNALQNAPDEQVILKKKKKKRDKIKIKFSFGNSKPKSSSCEVRNEIVTQAEVHHEPEMDDEPLVEIPTSTKSKGAVDISQPFLIHRKDGTTQYSTPIVDSKLPPGWHKHKAFFSNRWQGILINSDNKKFFSKRSLLKYFENNKMDCYSPDVFDFSLLEYNPKKKKSIDTRKSTDVNTDKVKTQSPTTTTAHLPVTPPTPLFSDFNVTVNGNYMCPKDSCKKEFRKENLLMMHLKHYHPEFKKMLPSALNVADLAFARTNSMDDNEDTSKPVKRSSGTYDAFQSSPATVKSSPPSLAPAVKSQTEQSSTYTHDVKFNKPLVPPLSHIKSKELDKVEVCDDNSMDIDFESQIAHFEIKKSEEKKSKPVSASTSQSVSVKKESATPEKKEPPKSNFTSPPSPCVKYEKMKKEEVVNCICGVLEEDGLMIQCDICLCWQHSHCSDIETESEVPEKYVCKICKNPPHQRRSRKYAYDQEWLHKGSLPTLDPRNKHCDEDFLRTQNILQEAHQITGSLCKLSDSMHNASIKMQIVQEPNHPKLYLWSQCVKAEEKKSLSTGPEPEAPIDSQDCRLHLLSQVDEDYDLMNLKLDELEHQIASAEADCSSLLGDPANDRPTLQMLIRDLETLRTLAIVN